MADTYSDLRWDYSINPRTKDINSDVDTEAVKSSIRNILMTSKGKRRMLPQFGASLEQLLFEPVDDFTAKRIGSMIVDEITYWDPRVILNKVNIIADEDNNLYEVNINYSVKASTVNSSSISFVLQQG